MQAKAEENFHPCSTPLHTARLPRSLLPCTGARPARYIIMFLRMENFTMAMALMASSGSSMGSWWAL